MSHEPGLRFWLRYAEGEGALIEDAGDQALAVLPESLQEAADLPEDVAVTSDPDVAREDGAVLLIPGHPALERAAAAVLEHGDVGRVHLPWPRSAPPRTAELQGRARERFQVEHGRIDAAGDARRAYVPLLRVGAMISYAVSLTHRFQEQEQVWVDARTGLGVPDGVLEALEGRPWLPGPDTTHTPMEADLALALRGAHAELEQRAITRQDALRVQARRALESELARADAYYHGALESIERRRASADPERRGLLDSQADSTRAEHARRRGEIEEEFEPRHEVRPFRLQLVFVPGFVLPVDVRRGARTFAFAFVWLAGARAFADVRCPCCGAAAELVAGRERLGCRLCTQTSAARREPSGAADALAAQRSPESRPPATVVPSPATARAPTARRAAGDGAQARPARGSPSGRTPSPPVRRASGGGRRDGRDRTPGALERTGNKLALAFWQSVADGTRWPRKKVARDSPLSALYRLYGPAGPLCALGIPPRQWPSQVTAATFPHASACSGMTTGAVEVGGLSYPYALCWRLEAGKPVVGEVMPAPHPAVLAPAAATETLARLHDLAPSPAIELDPVAAALWRAELPSAGLPITVRCLATWWRVRDTVDPSHTAPAIASAVAGAIARAAGQRRRRAETAATYGTDAEAVDRVERALGSALRLDRDRGW